MRLTSIAALATAAVVFGFAPAPATATTPAGTHAAPAGTNAAPSRWHGRLLGHAPLIGGPRLAGSGRTWSVTYLSTAWDGTPTVVSGAVSVPAGPPPVGGWPVVSFGHGFGGIADACAPSRTGPGPMERPVQETLLAAGYAVLVTDFDGIGTPGESSVIDGPSEAYAMIDLVLAARRLAPLSRSWAAVGYSMGGHAALFAGRLADTYAPALRQVGTVAMAPMTQWRLQLTAPPSRDPAAPVNPVLPFMTRTAAVTHADVYHPLDHLTATGMRLYRLAGRVCLDEMVAAVAGRTNGDVFTDPAASSDAFAAMYDGQEVPVGRYPRPVRIVHGTDDQIPYALSELTAGQLAAAGNDVTVTLVDGADHITLLPMIAPRLRGWLDSYFAEHGGA